MFQAAAQQRSIPGAVATVGVNDRVAFLRRTYGLLAVAVLAFVALAAAFVTSGLGAQFTDWMYRGGTLNFVIVMGLFIGSGYLTQRMAQSDSSVGVQYVGLVLGVLSYAIFLTPILYIAAYYVKDPYIIQKAGLFTLLVFAGLTATVFLTRKDFSFLRGILSIATLAAFGVILASWLFGFNLGTLFAVAMVVLMGGYVLFQTSLLMAHVRPTQHVAAALMLFSTIATLFLWILQLLMSLNRR